MSTNSILGAASGLSEIPLYPLLTREVDRNGTSSGTSTSPATPGGGLASLAKNAIRASLGWQHRSGDATANLKSFQAALGKAFRFKEVEGHTEWEWVAQGFSVQADLGEITGAQASIYRQAKAMLEQTLPVLDKVEALREGADQDDIGSMRAIIRSELTDLVDELGRPGGPRVQRIDHYFCLLIAAHENKPTVYDPQAGNFGGQLRRFLGRLGMDERRVNTVAEEVQYTDFLLLVDNVSSLHRNWLHKRPYFNGENTPFFGTVLMHLSRQMEVIAESVHELYSTLDSVYIGAAERQIVDLGGHVVFIDLRTEKLLKENKDVLGRLQERAGAVDDDLLEKWNFDDDDQPAAKDLLEHITEVDSVSEVLADLRQLIRFDNLDQDDRTTILRYFEVALETVGAEARSLSLEGLLSWIETFVTVEGRQLLEQGGKDGAATFALTICKFARFVGHLLHYSAQYATELHAEIGSALTQGRTSTSSLLDFHPGLHTTRVYRSIRELHTHLRAACRLSSKIEYRAPICTDDFESDDYDCADCDDHEEKESLPITQRSLRPLARSDDRLRDAFIQQRFYGGAASAEQDFAQTRPAADACDRKKADVPPSSQVITSQQPVPNPIDPVCVVPEQQYSSIPSQIPSPAAQATPFIAQTAPSPDACVEPDPIPETKVGRSKKN